ncbi:peptidoglycan-binding domain-containing protein [Falsiroseomonas sp. HC035]|uniref:peptidoglycan-binding domain-containing protein n=1 Tax=Falsiroseomonas sp. HC035 TaxID=3390999 RepID=UPI003D31A65D
MKRSAMLFGLLLGGPLLLSPLLAPVPAAAQAPPALTYAQPLGPEAVNRVQDRLRQAGAYSGRVDGIWGPDSQTALERYQQRNGLQVTGQLNQATATVLGLNPADLVGGPPGPAPAASAETLSEAVVRNVQGRLRSLGFYRSGVDGIWGPTTQAAIEQFQQGRGLQPNGQLTPATAAAMGLDPNNLAAPAR